MSSRWIARHVPYVSFVLGKIDDFTPRLSKQDIGRQHQCAVKQEVAVDYLNAREFNRILLNA
jgi:hypothetical protein